MTQPDKLTTSDRLSIEDVETIALNAESQERIPAYSALAVNIKYMAIQFADAIRENERLREALKFYADYHGNYKPKEFEMNSAIVNDGGKKAREALSNKDSK